MKDIGKTLEAKKIQIGEQFNKLERQRQQILNEQFRLQGEFRSVEQLLKEFGKEAKEEDLKK